MLTSLIKSNKLNIENSRSHILKMKGMLLMTKNELELINIIRENDNKEQAVITAMEVILSFLEQRESFPIPSAASLQVQA